MWAKSQVALYSQLYFCCVQCSYKARVRGAVLVGVLDRADLPSVATYGIKVDVPYRRRGIGYQLMQKAEVLAEMTGVDRLFVETRPDNAAALALYKKCGYTVFERTPERVKMQRNRSR